MSTEPNFILRSDSYKLGHHAFLPPGTKRLYSYLENRAGGRFPASVFFGLQAFRGYFEGEVVTEEMVTEAAAFFATHVPGNEHLFNREGWMHIVESHGGRLPLHIKAVPEGSVVPESNVLVTVENTDDDLGPTLAWLVNYIETHLLQLWAPITVATASRALRKMIGTELAKTTGGQEGLDFMLHDFGFRGTSSLESAAILGAAHLVNFQGSDNIPGVRHAQRVYGAEMPAFNIPATEHSTITAWGQEHEKDGFAHQLNAVPTGYLSSVSDQYNLYHAARNLWGKNLREMVLARDGKLVVRPDSGDPRHVLPTLLCILFEAFGGTRNEQGYLVLNPKVGVIQGDAITVDSLPEILTAITDAGFATSNLVFGSGGGLLQKWDRDTQRFAFKASWTQNTASPEGRDVYKDPVTGRDKHNKASKRGRMKLVGDLTLGSVETVAETDPREDLLETVFLNGDWVRTQTLDDIRERAAASPL